MEDNLNRGFGPSDLVFYQKDGKIMSGGFSIDNIFLKMNHYKLLQNHLDLKVSNNQVQYTRLIAHCPNQHPNIIYLVSD